MKKVNQTSTMAFQIPNKIGLSERQFFVTYKDNNPLIFDISLYMQRGRDHYDKFTIT